MKTKLKPKTVTLATCSESELCRLRLDNIQIGDFDIMTDSFTVWLGEQKPGEKARQTFDIPRPTFNRLIRWYLQPKKLVRKPM